MLTINGSQGEGGGQILRTSIGLSLVTGQPIDITNIRAGRKRPGLGRQHVTSVRAAAEIGNAEVAGLAVGSSRLTFKPTAVTPGDYTFSIGTAGSATLVLQTILPALLTADRPSRLTLEGGTHNPFAPPFDFLAKTFLPLINRMGPKVRAALERPGFYPAGGGRVIVDIEPTQELDRLELLERGEICRQTARAVVANLPIHIAERELRVLRRKLKWDDSQLIAEEASDSIGPGNVVIVAIESDHVTEVITAFGQRGIRAEDVARQAAAETRRYLDAEVPVGEHLADQLLIPLALGQGGRFKTTGPTLHTQTNIDVIAHFLDTRITAETASKDEWIIEVAK